ncbi:MAG: ABC transporter substrate-binding protein [Candidatus Eremiobacterota bacterium]
MKKILLFLIITIITINMMPVFAGEPVTINFWHAMDRHRGKVLNNLVDEFNKTHPDIKVVATFKGVTDNTKDKYKNSYNILFQQLLISISTQSPPDVSQVYENWTSQFVQIKSITPLENVAEKEFTEKELPDFIPTFLEANKEDGKLWSLPFNKSIYVLYYNKYMLSKAGLKPPANWEEVREAAKKLTQKTSSGKTIHHGISFKADVDTFSVILLSRGGTLLEGNKKATFNGEEGEKTIKYLQSLIEDGSAITSFEPQKDFMEGKCAMYVDTSSGISNLERHISFEYGVAPCPYDKGKILFAGTNLAIFSASSQEKQKASWEFIKWLTNTENTAKWSMETGYLPVRNSAIESKAYQEFLSQHEKHKIGINELSMATVAPIVPSWQSIRGIIDDTVFNTVVVKQDIKETLNTAATTADRFLGLPQK